MMKNTLDLIECSPDEAINLLKNDFNSYLGIERLRTKKIPDEILNHKTVVTFLLARDGSNIRFLSKKWRNDKEMMLLAMRSSTLAPEWLGEDLKNDREVALQAVRAKGNYLSKFSSIIRDDKEIVLAAVTNSSHALEYASERLKDDDEVVWKALEDDGNLTKFNGIDVYGLKYASDRLKDKKEIVLHAFKNIRGYKDAQNITSDGKEFLIDFAKTYGLEFDNLSSKNKLDKDIVLATLDFFPFDIVKLDEVLQKDLDIVSKVLLRNLETFKVCHDDVKKNKHVALYVVKRNEKMYKELPLKLKNDDEVILTTLQTFYQLEGTPSLEDMKKMFSKKIREEIGSNDPLSYFKSKMAAQQLNKVLTNSNQIVAKAKI